MQKISAEKLIEIVGSSSNVVAAEFDRVITDSRQAAPGVLFVALRGEKFDGHDFVGEVLQNGAALALVEHLVRRRNVRSWYLTVWKHLAKSALLTVRVLKESWSV